jgi:hypothetical protein
LARNRFAAALRSGLGAATVLAGLVVLASCSAEPRWHTKDITIDRDAARLFRREGAAGAPREPYANEVAVVPMREHMRPCCAFGAQLHVRVGRVPIPLYFLGNMVDAGKIRHHVYDSGNATFGSRGGTSSPLVQSEGNGLVYTCRAGFIDIAHVRDYADTSLYLITSIARQLENGGVIPMPDEGAKVTVELSPADPKSLAQHGRWAIATPLGQWLAYQSSLWHEIVTWFGWSTFALFPERVSSFSPEDLYSNLLGARIGAAVVSQRGARDEFAYNRSVDTWLRRTLQHLGAVPAKTAEEAMRSMDGLWWDSKQRIPDMSLVLRRNFSYAESLDPWLVPPAKSGPLLRAACGENPRPLPIENPSSISGVDFAGQATLVIDLPQELAAKEPFVNLGTRITQREFPQIVEFIAAENERMFGPDANRP